MAPQHARSISLPSRSNPLTLGVEDQLNKLKASQATTSSTSPSSICQNLAALNDLFSQVDDLIQFPLAHEDKCINEVVEGSLKVLDVCETTRDVLSQMKQNVQDLQSAYRRKRGDDSSLANDVAAYKISKKVVFRKCLAVLKRMQNKQSTSSLVAKDQQIVNIISLLRDVEEITMSVFGSILSFVAGPKEQSKSLLSKLMHSKSSRCKVEDQTELEALESTIQELEEDVDGLFRCLIKTRVSLLNNLN